MSALVSVIRRELTVALRRKSDIVNPLLFYLITIALFPLAVGPEPALLTRIAPGIVWVAALLSSLLAFERLFRDDFDDGSLEQLLLAPVPLPLIVLGKVIGHWLLTGLPLLLVSPVVALLLGMHSETYWAWVATLLIGTPYLSLLGAIGVALTLGVGRGGVLLSLLILPLFMPQLIFATAVIDSAAIGLSYSGQLALMGALTVLALTLAPFAIAASLRLTNG